MNILLEQPPRSVIIGGREYAINCMFRTGIQFELMVMEGRASIGDVLRLWYPRIPPDRDEALSRALWFYRCGRDMEERGLSGTREAAYDFGEDADSIFSSFRDAYCIDLSECDMHWWVFRKLMLGLPEETRFKRIVHWRVADTDAMTGALKRQYLKLKKQFALKRRPAMGGISLMERNGRWRRYVDERYAKADDSGGTMKT